MKSVKFDIFKKELDILDHSENILREKEHSTETLLNEYDYLSQKYRKLLTEMMKITRIGDMNYKKIMDANEQIRVQKKELERLNQQLRDANLAKDRFYSIIAHDLRNPLQFLLLSSDLLDSEYSMNAESWVRKFIGKVFKTARHLSELLENLLQWSLSQYGELESRPKNLDLNILSDENIDYFIDIARDKGILLESKIPENTWVFADEEMVKSILRNLVSNAVKFTSAGGKVFLSTSRDGDFIHVLVRDTGVGIAPEIQTQLFKLWQNTTTNGTAKEKGTGMGLVLCKEFIERNGGQLKVESTVGHGALFEFTLPVARKGVKQGNL